MENRLTPKTVTQSPPSLGAAAFALVRNAGVYTLPARVAPTRGRSGKGRSNMRNHANVWALTLGLALSPVLGLAQQQHDGHAHGGTAPPPGTLGQVRFPVSCTPEAQAAFDDAMKLQHSFWYEAAAQAFRRVRERDPGCAMAYWGEAMALLVNPFVVTSAANLRQGRALLAEAKRIGAKSEREAGFIDALGEWYGDEDPATHRARVVRYEQAMERLHARFPEEPEVAIHYALALAVAASPHAPRSTA